MSNSKASILSVGLFHALGTLKAHNPPAMP